MTLWRDPFLVVLFGIAHFVPGPFWSRPFKCEFYENIFFLLLFVSIFLIYKKNFCLFFQKQLKDFCLFLINFFLLYIKKYKFEHTATEGYF